MAKDSAAFTDVVIDESASGDQTIVSGVAGKRIVVHNYLIVAGAAVTVRWKSGATNKSGPIALAANGGVSAPGGIENRWFATGIGEDLVLNLGGAVAVGGHVAYTTE